MSTFSSTQGADASSAGAYANGVSSGAECPSGREQKQSAKNFRIQGLQISEHNHIILQKPLGQSSQMSSGSDDATTPGDVPRWRGT